MDMDTSRGIFLTSTNAVITVDGNWVEHNFCENTPDSEFANSLAEWQRKSMMVWWNKWRLENSEEH